LIPKKMILKKLKIKLKKCVKNF